jgi:hypothetical protein
LDFRDEIAEAVFEIDAESSSAACFSMRSLKNTLTAWPKMMGSETFIMVAFMCSENSTPSALAAAICSARKIAGERGLAHEGGVEDLTGLERGGFLEDGGEPSAATSSMRTSVASTVTDFSLEKKSPLPFIEPTRVLESADHAPILCGWALA